jgi:hypothetical protein
MLADAVECLPGDHQEAVHSNLALIEILFRYFAHPVHPEAGCLHRSFGIVIRKIAGSFGHSFAPWECTVRVF